MSRVVAVPVAIISARHWPMAGASLKEWPLPPTARYRPSTAGARSTIMLQSGVIVYRPDQFATTLASARYGIR